jgi:hypothetical protein
MKVPFKLILAAAFCGVGVSAVNAMMQKMCGSDGAFPVARGVLVRFAGEEVEAKFTFERMFADEPMAEVSAAKG